VQILYTKGGKVYIASRSATKIAAEIQAIKKGTPNPTGEVKSLLVDLSDLSTIQSRVSSFVTQETRLNVLFNNAGGSQSPASW
jgi:NADP-dependent 3-hydroxy acid dehydrogenase YdfG